MLMLPSIKLKLSLTPLFYLIIKHSIWVHFLLFVMVPLKLIFTDFYCHSARGILSPPTFQSTMLQRSWSYSERKRSESWPWRQTWPNGNKSTWKRVSWGSLHWMLLPLWRLRGESLTFDVPAAICYNVNRGSFDIWNRSARCKTWCMLKFENLVSNCNILYVHLLNINAGFVFCLVWLHSDLALLIHSSL